MMKTQQTVVAGDLKEFAELVYEFTKMGLTFEAYAVTLTINLTGGY